MALAEKMLAAQFNLDAGAIVQPASWMDEYGRIAGMFDSALKPEVHIKVPKAPGPAVAVGAAK
jgi:hypothetical protein